MKSPAASSHSASAGEKPAGVLRRALRYGPLVLERAARVRRCGAGVRDSLRYADALTRRRRGPGRAVRMRLGWLSFWARPEDWVTVQECCLLDEYGFLGTLFKGEPPQVVVDLGANIGLFSLTCLARWPGCTVHAVEPAPDTFSVLERNRAEHPEFAWHTHQLAIDDACGTVRFTAGAYSTANRIAGDGGVEVSATTLPALFDVLGFETIDLLKMDIEGAEERALAAATAVLGRVRCFVMELHPERCDAEHVLDILRRTYQTVEPAPRAAAGKPLIIAREPRGGNEAPGSDPAATTSDHDPARGT